MKFKGIEKKNFLCIIRYSKALYNRTAFFDVSKANKKINGCVFMSYFLQLKLKLIDFGNWKMRLCKRREIENEIFSVSGFNYFL